MCEGPRHRADVDQKNMKDTDKDIRVPSVRGGKHNAGLVSREVVRETKFANRPSRDISGGVTGSVATPALSENPSGACAQTNIARGNGSPEEDDQSPAGVVPIEKEYGCRHCERAFATPRGRGVHERRAHAAAVISSREETDAPRKRRWTDEERSAIAQREAELERKETPPGEILGVLASEFEGRSREALKRARYTKVYIRMLSEARLKAKAQGGEFQGRITRSISRARAQSDQDGGTATEESRHEISDGGSNVTGDSNAQTTENPGETYTREVDNEFRRWLRSRFGRSDKVKPKAGGKVKLQNGAGFKNRAQRRNVMRARWLGAYERDGARTARLVLEGKSLDGQTGYPKGTVGFWRDQYETSFPVDLIRTKPGREGRFDSLMTPFTEEEVGAHLKGMRRGAKGPDGVKLEDLRNPERLPEIVTWFNRFLETGRIPVLLKRFSTTLIPKVERPQKPGDYRPISVGSFLRRLFTGLLAKRLRIVDVAAEQRGFKQEEGCAIHLHTLKALIKDSISRGKDLSYMYLDVAKAFDSVNHEAMLSALSGAGLPNQMVKLVGSLYKGNTTMLKNLEPHRAIRINRGVLQGDPLSPILFNLCMEKVYHTLSPKFTASLGATKINSLLFADDVVLLAQTAEGLQANVNNFTEGLGRFGMRLNISKCAAVHIRHNRKRKRWYVAKEPKIRVIGKQVRNLLIGESYRYLGCRVSSSGGGTQETTEISEKLNRIGRSFLKPQQRLEILNRNLIPSLVYPLEFSNSNGGRLERADKLIRKSVRSWLHLAHDTPTAIFHTKVGDGGLGIPSLRTRVQRLRFQRISRLGNIENPDRIVLALRSSEYWTELVAKIGNSVGRPGEEFRSSEEERKLWASRLYASCDGKGLEHHWNAGGYRSRWVANGFKLSGKEYVSAVRARCNNLATRSRKCRGRQVEKGRNCPACPTRPETLNHLVQVCGRTHDWRIKRHNIVVDYVTTRLRKNGLGVLKEPRIPVGNSFLKPDIVAYDKRKRKLFIWDPSIVGDQVGMEGRSDQKIAKYEIPAVKSFCAEAFGEINLTEVSGLIVDWRGAWAPGTWRTLVSAGVPPALLDMLSFKLCKNAASMYYCTRRRTDA